MPKRCRAVAEAPAGAIRCGLRRDHFDDHAARQRKQVQHWSAETWAVPRAQDDRHQVGTHMDDWMDRD